MNYELFTSSALVSLGHFWPELLVAMTVVAILVVDLLFIRGRGKRQGPIELVALVGLAAAFVATCASFETAPQLIFSGMAAVDPFGAFFKLIYLVAGAIFICLTMTSDEIPVEGRTEYYTMALGGVLGMMLMATSTHMVMVFLAIEFVSLSSYVMAGFLRDDRRSSEAALKYVLYGSVSSAVMLYGMSMLYGLTGSTSLIEANRVIFQESPYPMALFVSLVLVLAGIGFKIACVPFHFWAPDVYEGAPTPVTAFFTVAPKAAGLAVTMRFLITLLTTPTTGAEFWTFVGNVNWPLLVSIIAAMSMTLGNFAALQQENIKRLMAYSSISHVGFALMGMAALSPSGVTAILVYVAAYLVMNLGAFLVIVLVGRQVGSMEISDYRGLFTRHPILGICLVVFLYSLTGLPPSMGFVAKFLVFSEAIRGEIYWLAVVGALNSVVALAYYFRIARVMWDPERENARPRIPLPHFATGVTVALAVVTLAYGVPWGPLEKLATFSSTLFLGR